VAKTETNVLPSHHSLHWYLNGGAPTFYTVYTVVELPIKRSTICNVYAYASIQTGSIGL
jgi:hypothetical protein